MRKLAVVALVFSASSAYADSYEMGVRIGGFTLTVEERGDLMTFLAALTDPTLAANPALAPPL